MKRPSSSFVHFQASGSLSRWTVTNGPEPRLASNVMYSGNFVPEGLFAGASVVSSNTRYEYPPAESTALV